MKMNNQTAYRKRPTAEICNELYVIVLALETAACEPLRFEGTAMRIWQNIGSNGFTNTSLTRLLALEYGVESASIAQDVDDFVCELEGHGLVTRDLPPRTQRQLIGQG